MSESLSQPQPSPNSRSDSLELLARLRADQRERWRRGERVPAEAYRDEVPELRADRDTFFSLVFSEFMLRDELGESPRLEEYIQRFPDFERDLRQQHEVYQAIKPPSLPAPQEAVQRTPLPPTGPEEPRTDGVPALAP